MNSRSVLPDETLIQRIQYLEERVRVLERVGNQGVTLQPQQVTTYVPETSITIGNGQLEGAYATFGDSLFWFWIHVVWGSTSSNAGEIFFYTPAEITATSEVPYQIVSATVRDVTGDKKYNGVGYVGYYWDEVYTPDTTTIVRLSVGTNANFVTATSPITLAAGDEIYVAGVVQGFTNFGNVVV